MTVRFPLAFGVVFTVALLGLEYGAAWGAFPEPDKDGAAARRGGPLGAAETAWTDSLAGAGASGAGMRMAAQKSIEQRPLSLASPKSAPLFGPVRSFEDPKLRENWIDAQIQTLAAPLQNDPYAVIDTCIAAEMAAYGAPAASIAVAVNGVITYTKGYGVRHPTDGGTIDTETMFGIGSTTKMMTAAALMTLAEESKIDLNAPISDVAPELALAPPWDISEITPHHLLSQTSGLPDGYLLAHTVDEFFTITLDEWVTDGLSGTAANAPPGSFWNYSNPNFSLAGYLVEKLAGAPYAEAIEERVWEPAGMPLTTLDMDAVRSHGNYATGIYDGELIGPGTLEVGALGPAGMAFSTPTELVTWALAMSGGPNPALQPESVTAMKARHANLGYDPWEHYGYGIFVTDYHDAVDPSQAITVFEHGGNIFGYGSQLYWVPERGLAFSILDSSFNSLNYSAGCVLRELAGIAPPSPLDVPPDAGAWESIAGNYAVMNTVQWDTSLAIRLADLRDQSGGLVVLQDTLTGDSVPLVNLFGRTFFIDADADGEPDQATAGYDVTFVDDADGNPRWMRNRLEVGQKVGAFPGGLTIEGNACTGMALESDLDATGVVVSAAGVTDPVSRLEDQPIAQDDPADPSTASWKHDISANGTAEYAFFEVTAAEGDTVELYLLLDEDRNGVFAYPSEVVSRGYETTSNARVLYLPGLAADGDYQAWVHGVSVGGEGHTFVWSATIYDGGHLGTEGAPDTLSAGQSAEMSVCAQGTEPLAGPRVGVVSLEYGSPPRRILTRVEWEPADGGTLLLPAVYNGAPERLEEPPPSTFAPPASGGS